MNIELLLSIMGQNDFSIIQKNRIQTDAVIINQSDNINYKESNINKKLVRMYTYDERGIGISRNQALLHSKAEICLMSDDDIVYVEDYETIIQNEFSKLPDADMILFNIKFINKDGSISMKNKNERINRINFMKHGTPEIAFKREKIISKGLFFSLMFGGGSRFGSGEDSIFLKEALDKGLKIYSSEKVIGTIDNSIGSSTWFQGFNEKYLYDKGALFKKLFPKIWLLIIVQFIVRHRKLFKSDFSMVEMLMIMVDGAYKYPTEF